MNLSWEDIHMLKKSSHTCYNILLQGCHLHITDSFQIVDTSDRLGQCTDIGKNAPSGKKDKINNNLTINHAADSTTYYICVIHKDVSIPFPQAYFRNGLRSIVNCQRGHRSCQEHQYLHILAVPW